MTARKTTIGPEIRWVGLCGYSGSGKDTAAAGLLADGWARVAVSDIVGDMLYEIDPKIEPGVRAASLIGEIGYERSKEHPEVLRLLQRIGSACRHVLADDVIVQATLRRAEAALDGGAAGVVFTSCRHPNEMEPIVRNGGIVVWVQRPGIGPVNDWETEHAWVPWAQQHALVVHNDQGPEHVQEWLRNLVA